MTARARLGQGYLGQGHNVRITIRGVDARKACDRYRVGWSESTSAPSGSDQFALVISHEPGQQDHEGQYCWNPLDARRPRSRGAQGGTAVSCCKIQSSS